MYYNKLTAIFHSLLRRALTICLVLHVIPTAGAQEKSPNSKTERTNPSNTSDKATTTTEKSPVPDKSAGGPQEGINVHGHWVIVVRNADGSVASTNEFENALFSGSGNVLLANVLGHKNSTGFWSVNLNVVNGSVTNNLPLAESSGGLTLTLNNGLIVLTGTTKLTAAGNITQVGTVIFACFTTVTPAGCAGGLQGASTPQNFTSHTLASPIPVQNGQTIDVTVSISFS